MFIKAPALSGAVFQQTAGMVVAYSNCDNLASWRDSIAAIFPAVAGVIPGIARGGHLLLDAEAAPTILRSVCSGSTSSVLKGMEGDEDIARGLRSCGRYRSSIPPFHQVSIRRCDENRR